MQFIDNQCFSVLNTTAMFITGIVSHLVSTLYDPSTRYMAYKRRTIQHSSRKLKLRLLVCVHQEEQVPNIINLLEMSNPTRESPIAVYLLHLIELVGRATPLLVAHQPFKHFDHRPTPIINAFRMYERNNLSIVTLQPFTSIAPYATMHNDICTLALDKRASLIILPFHRQWNTDHTKDISKFRSVNLRVLDKAPCSVGIIIDRGAWRGTKSVLGSWSLFRVGVFFIGGADDREAVAYAMRMSEHPNVTVTLVRFLPLQMTINDHDPNERRMDNDMINEFKVSKVGSEKALYKEEMVVDSVCTCSGIRSMENSFDLILVGRRHEENSPMVYGLNDWMDYPELGFLGDILASEDFTGKVSTLVIQQHSWAAGEESSRRSEDSPSRQDSFLPQVSPNGLKGY